jgi:hypothetical protein
VEEIIILFLALAKFLKPKLTDKLIVFFHECFLLIMTNLVVNISSTVSSMDSLFLSLAFRFVYSNKGWRKLSESICSLYLVDQRLKTPGNEHDHDVHLCGQGKYFLSGHFDLYAQIRMAEVI